MSSRLASSACALSSFSRDAHSERSRSRLSRSCACSRARSSFTARSAWAAYAACVFDGASMESSTEGSGAPAAMGDGDGEWFMAPSCSSSLSRNADGFGAGEPSVTSAGAWFSSETLERWLALIIASFRCLKASSCRYGAGGTGGQRLGSRQTMGEITFRSDILINGRGGSRCVDARRYRGWEPGRGGTLRLPASSEACRFLSTDDIVSVWSGAVLCVRPPRKAPEGNGSPAACLENPTRSFVPPKRFGHRHRHGSQEGGDPGGAAPAA